MKRNLRNKRIIIATHYRIYSASQALRDFVRFSGCQNLLFIGHPLPLPDVATHERSYIEESRGNRIVARTQAPFRVRNVVLSGILETGMTLWWALRTPSVFDLFIGVDNLNALQGLMLKFFGKVKKVVYYTIDYFPTRFTSPILNAFYYMIDKLCVRYADETWNVSPVMASVRARDKGMVGKGYSRQYTVPIGIWYDRAPRKPISAIDQYKLVFSGHLVPHMGVDLIIRALPTIAKKVPKISLEIIGGGVEESRLKMLAHKLGVEKRVVFHGWVTDRNLLEKLLSNAAVGLAPFNTEILDEKVKNADPGKIKDYMALGMPVVVTDAIATSSAIKKAHAGIVIRYGEEDLARAVIQLVTNKATLSRYRANALAYVRQFDYNRLFRNAFNRVLKP